MKNAVLSPDNRENFKNHLDSAVCGIILNSLVTPLSAWVQKNISNCNQLVFNAIFIAIVIIIFKYFYEKHI